MRPPLRQVEELIKKFNVQLGLLTFMALFLVLGIHTLFAVAISKWTWIAFIYFISLTFFLHWLGERALNKSHKTFLNFVYGTAIIRFIFSIFFIVIYLVINKVADRSFIFAFVFLYLFYTTFELIHLVAKLRTEK